MMSFTVSMTSHGRWAAYAQKSAVVVYEVAATTSTDAIDKGKAMWAVEHGQQMARAKHFDKGWNYFIPPEGTLVPMGRKAAEAMGTLLYVGKACGKHPLNNIRLVSNRSCVICLALQDYGQQ